MPNYALQFPADEIKALAGRYQYASNVTAIQALVPKVRDCGYLTKSDLLTVAQWKAPRAVPKIAMNEEALIIDATRGALATPHERLRIGTLTLLHGVGYPMASVILHWYHTDRYPIVDYRALWSLGRKTPPAFYTFDFWMSYVTCCRQLAAAAGVDMRTLDKALWQYSKENQPPKSTLGDESCM
jgi:hypothetical protein